MIDKKIYSENLVRKYPEVISPQAGHGLVVSNMVSLFEEH